MANKPYNLYNDSGPEAKIQARGVKSVTGGLASVAKVTPAAYIGRGAKSVAGGFMDDVNGTRAAVGKTPIKMPGNPFATKTAQAETQLPETVSNPVTTENNIVQSAQQPSKTVGHVPSSPAKPSAMTIGKPGEQITINQSANDMAIKNSLGAIDQRIAGGETPTPKQAQKIQQLREQAGFLRGGTDRHMVGPDGRPIARGVDGSMMNKDGSQQVGNMDVKFDSSIAPENDVAGFMQKPVAPTAQMARGVQRMEPVYNGLPISVANALGKGPGQEAASTGAKAPELYTPESHPNMPWKERLALNVANANNQGATSIAQMNNTTDLTQANIAATGVRRGQDIDASNVAGQNALRGQEVANSQFDLGEKQQLADLQAQYENEKNPNIRKQLENQIYARLGKPQQKYQIATDQDIDPVTGMTVKKSYLIDESGNTKPLTSDDGLQELPKEKESRRIGWHTVKGRAVYWDGKNVYDTKPEDAK